MASSSDILLSQSWSEDYLSIIFNSFLGQLFPYLGLLLLDETGQLMHSNPKARELCQVLQSAHDSLEVSEGSCGEMILPCQVTRHCKVLIKSRLKFPDNLFHLKEIIYLENGEQINLTIEWVSLLENLPSCILVRLEDMTQSACYQAKLDTYRYNLTRREKEVWTLYLQGRSYHQIGHRLFISPNTVRKHMKSIYSKRRDNLSAWEVNHQP